MGGHPPRLSGEGFYSGCSVVKGLKTNYVINPWASTLEMNLRRASSNPQPSLTVRAFCP